MSNQLLPLPERLEPKDSAHTLMTSVRMHFYGLYNSANTGFREFLASVGNKDAITGNRLFDRHNAVTLIKKAAKDTKDQTIADAKDGDIYRCLVRLLHDNGLGLKLRRADYKRLTQQPAE